MKVELFTILFFAAEVFSNCGCLKCNKELKVVSRPCSPVTIIAKNARCGSLCSSPKDVPYEIEVPILPQRERIRSFPISGSSPVSLCHRDREVDVFIPNRLDAVAQVPLHPRPIRLLENLEAAADRIVINCERPLPRPLPLLPRPSRSSIPLEIIEFVRSLPVGQIVHRSPPEILEKLSSFSRNELLEVFPEVVVGEILSFGRVGLSDGPLIPVRPHPFDSRIPIEIVEFVQSLPVHEIGTRLPRAILDQLLAFPQEELLEVFPEVIVRELFALKPFRGLIEHDQRCLLEKPCASPPNFERLHFGDRFEEEFLVNKGIPACGSCGRVHGQFSPCVRIFFPPFLISRIQNPRGKRSVKGFFGKNFETQDNTQRPEIMPVVYGSFISKKIDPVITKRKNFNNIDKVKILKRLQRPKRTLSFAEDGQTQFFRIKDESEEEQGEIFQKRTKTQDPFLSLFNFDHIFHHTPIFHLLNTPVRYLSHFHNLRKHLLPVVDSVPKVVQNTKKYILDYGKQFGRNLVNFGSNLLGSFTNFREIGNNFRPILPRNRRDLEEQGKNDTGPKPEDFYQSFLRILKNLRFVRNTYDGDNNDKKSVSKRDLQSSSNDTNIEIDRNETETIVQTSKKEILQSSNQDSITNLEISKNPDNEIPKNFQLKTSSPDNTINLSILIKNYLKTVVDRKEDDFDYDFELAHPNLDPEEEGKPAGSLEEVMRKKRTILKVVDENEVEDFILNQLNGLNKPNLQNFENRKKKLVLEPLNPKILIDDHGLGFFDINGKKSPIIKNHGIKDTITQIIEKAKKLSADDQLVKSPEFFHTDLQIQTIKDHIKQILEKIQKLINYDSDNDYNIFLLVAKIESIKTDLIKDWKVLLASHCSNMQTKLQFLTQIQEMQNLKDLILKSISFNLNNDFVNVDKKIKILIRLQKLQCVLHRIVEDFQQKIETNVQNFGDEVKSIRNLESIVLLEKIDPQSIRIEIKRERDQELQKLIDLLETLKNFLNENPDSEIFQKEVKILWEIKNAEKLQQECIYELNRKIDKKMKLRKELKILFDLQKHLQNLHRQQVKLAGKLQG